MPTHMVSVQVMKTYGITKRPYLLKNWKQASKCIIMTGTEGQPFLKSVNLNIFFCLQSLQAPKPMGKVYRYIKTLM